MPDKTHTLGVSGVRTGFAVSLFDRETLLFAIEEDKLRRSKGAGIMLGTPRGSQAIAAAMEMIGGAVDRLDGVVYAPPNGATDIEIDEDVSFLATFLDRFHSITAPITSVDHVLAQMAFAAAVQPDAETVLMVGQTRVASARAGNQLSLGFTDRMDVVRVAEELAEYLGLFPGQIHHLESIARLGEPRFADLVDEVVRKGPGPGVEALEKALRRPRLRRGFARTSEYYDVAASIHHVMNRRVCDVVRSVIDGGAGVDVALCGGVFHSWTLNDALAAEFPENRFSISFAPGNAGCAIGGPMVINPAALRSRPRPLLGPRYGRDEVKTVLDNCKTRYEFRSSSDTIDVVCDALADGKMVGWFGGRCEFGLRALGARSVFTNPANPYACDNLSSYLKKRPSYMSYAVVMTEEDSPVMSPFLSRSTRLPEYFGDSPVRVQTVSRASSPVLYQLLTTFRDRLSVPALLNTSLNYFDEPIACAPRDAVKTFYASGLDMLVMENFTLRKN